MANLHASRDNFQIALMKKVKEKVKNKRKQKFHKSHLNWGIMPLPCLAPGIHTNSRSLPAVRSLCANLDHLMFFGRGFYFFAILYINIWLVLNFLPTHHSKLEMSSFHENSSTLRLSIVFLWNLYLVAGVMYMSNSSSQAMVGGILASRSGLAFPGKSSGSCRFV